jgi:replicative DNA helicase
MARISGISDQPLPNNLDAEQFVLAYMLQNPAAYPDLAQRIAPDDFSLEFHRRIFSRISELFVRQMPIDLPTLGKEMTRHGELGPDGLARLVDLDTGMPAILDVMMPIIAAIRSSRI